MRNILKRLHGIAIIAFTISLSSCSLLNNVVNREKYDQIQKGMSYEEVFKIIGSEPSDSNSKEWGNYIPTILIWRNINGSEVRVYISYGEVYEKTEKGL